MDRRQTGGHARFAVTTDEPGVRQTRPSGGTTMKCASAFFFTVAVALGLTAPTVALELNDSEQPGSVLVFHKFLRPANTDTVPVTQFEISVVCPAGDCDEDVQLRGRWVCPGNQENFRCYKTDISLSIAVNGTALINSANFDPPPPCNQGFLVVWVVNGDGQPIKFDRLIGNAVIREADGSAGAYNALPIQAASVLSEGARTDIFTNVGNDIGNAGDLKFDGGATHYKALSGKIFGTVRYETARIHTFLTLLTLDVLAGSANFPTFVDLYFYKENGTLALSTNTHFVCWTEVRLREIHRGLRESPGMRKGLVESVSAEKVSFRGFSDTAGDVTLVGIVETKERNGLGEIIREYAYSLFHDATTVPTLFDPNGP
jgi:hypothetical protein